MLSPSNPDHFILWAAKGTYNVQIAVPADQAQRAAEILWVLERPRAQRVARLAAIFRRQVAVTLGSAGLLAAVLVLLLRTRWPGKLGDLTVRWVWLTIVGAVLWGVVGRGIREYRRQRRAAAFRRCANCGYLLLGLIDPRCPECGQAFDATQLPRLAPTMDSTDDDQPLRPTAGDLIRRAVGVLMCFWVFNWSFVPPWRAALEEPKGAEPRDEEREES